MDYFVELANTPDVYDAIVRDDQNQRKKSNGAGPANGHGKATERNVASRLLLRDFLRNEHPAAWVTELIHAFYECPAFASRVWVQLRYCSASQKRLAEYQLRQANAWAWNKKATHARIEPFVKMFATEPDRAVNECALRLDDATVDELLKKSGLYPEPPSFLGTLLRANDESEDTFDARTRVLLASPDAVRKLARDTCVAVPFSMVLNDELDQIDATRGTVRRAVPSPLAGCTDTPPAYNGEAPLRRALNMNLLGLAFSGGGIRSATFNLGVLQALSKVGLLRQCDYLSTVSGGGYIGSWLAGWIRREANTGLDGTATMMDIQRRLSPVRSPNPMDERVRPIRFLREYSNYLTPRTGFFSADTWTMIGIYLRNALLNQVIIVSLLGAALIVPRILFWLTSFGTVIPPVPWLLWIVGSIVLTANLARLRPGQATRTMSMGAPTVALPIDRFLDALARPAAIQIGVVLAWLIAAALAAATYGPLALSSTAADERNRLALAAGVVVAVSFFAILLFGGTHRCWADPAQSKGDSTPRRLWHAVWVILLAAVVSGVVASGLTWVLMRVLSTFGGTRDENLWHAMGLGTAGLLSVVSLSIVAMLGMLGEKFPDEQREWWSRLRTFMHVWAIAWLVAFVVALYVPWGFRRLLDVSFGKEFSATAVITWIASTWFGVSKGRTSEDDEKQQHEASGPVPLSTTAVRLASQAAPFVFIVGLVFGISIAVDQIFRVNVDHNATVDSWQHYWTFATLVSMGKWTAGGIVIPWTSGVTAALLGVGLLFSWRVDINDFSLHHFYKNRLVRCYLGASHGADRHADRFTGFDPDDDLLLKHFDERQCSPRDPEGRYPRYPGPYPIVNCALNLVAGEDLAWQERKSTSFVFTPKYCGYDVDRAVVTRSRDRLRDDAYVPTADYYSKGEGPYLGMAMAISGAAANPNMGRASSPALAFLMTVFNVRLGWWVRNPRKTVTVSGRSPRLGLPYTALELFGMTDDRKQYVNLSDGGHFENLGVYELVRRGCRYVIVCDAGQDPKFVGEDLANLVRQCRTDFGVEIDIDIHRIRDMNSQRRSQTHCVVGKIHYLGMPRRTPDGRLMNEDEGPLLRGSRPAHEEGYLIYLKPSLTGNEPQDVVEYSLRIPEFPHQTTADQWFDESQFESYRKLGMHIAEEAFGRYQDDDTKPLADVGQLFNRLYRYWYPPSQAIDSNSTFHVTEYSRIMELIRTQSGLQNLDHTMFEKWPAAGRINPRDEFYICNALIQLVENVYSDLDLEHLWDHPHVEGWRRVFERWAQQPEFQRTWVISEHTYAERFRNFYNDRLRGRRIALPRSFVASHRGRSIRVGANAIENTVDAFEQAIRQGASVVELDVRKLADGQLVLWHDDTINGTAVETFTLAQLKQLAPAACTLFECADLLNGIVQFDIEMKTKGIEADLVHALRQRNPVWRRRDFVVTSFYQDSLDTLHGIDPLIRTGLLLDTRHAYENALSGFADSGADFLGPDERLLSKADLDLAFERRVPLVPWSVNTRDRLELLLAHETVAGVITDDVLTAVEVKQRL